MNILYLIDFLGTGGVESYIYSLAKAYRKDHRIFLCYGHEKHGLEKFQSLDIEIIQLPMRNFYDLKAAKELSQLCRDYEIDVVHTHFLRENGVATLSKLFGNQAKIINTRHMPWVNRGLTRLVNRQIVRGNDYVIAVSESVREILIRELGDLKKIKRIYTGIDLKNFKNRNYDFRKRYGIDQGEVVITSTARLSPEKGQEFILDAIPIVLSQIDKPVRFVFVGNGPDREKLEAKVREMGLEERVLFLGYQQDIASILLASDIFLLCSQSEAFGIAILEAMACQLPVIATSTGGITEIIGKDLSAGRLVDYGREDQLSNELIQLIEDKAMRRELGTCGQALVESKFNLNQTIQETLKLYEN